MPENDNDVLNLFIPITKIDEEKRLLYGTVTEELVDKSGEAFDYDSSKPYYEKWSAEFEKATDGKSLGNLRAMHANKVAGKLTQLSFDDSAKRIDCVAKVLDDNEWRMCLEGAYTGFSQGGRYVKRWKDDKGTQKYTVNPVEVSLVDSPCLSTARFSLLKADGTVEEKGFKAVDAAAKQTDQAAPNKADDVTSKEEKAEAPPSNGMTEDEYLRRASGVGLDQGRDTLGKRDCGYPLNN